jgi:hypothetical protein
MKTEEAQDSMSKETLPLARLTVGDCPRFVTTAMKNSL